MPTASPEELAALAPTGTLRVGVTVGSPTSLLRDAAGNESGVLHDLARELARQLAVPIHFFEFRSVPEILAALEAGQLDLTGTNATPARAARIDYTATVVEMELGYLVAGPSTLCTADDARRQALRIGVVEGSTSQTALPRTLPHAVIVPVPGLAAAGPMLADGAIDAFTTNKPALFEIADTLAGSRVLPGTWGQEQWALGLPRNRGAGLAGLEKFLALARERGWVASAMQRAGLRGAAAV